MTGTGDLPDSDALLNALRTSDQALRLSDGERTAFAAFDPVVGDDPREEFYWYETWPGGYGTAAREDTLNAGDLAFRIGVWGDPELVSAEAMAEAIVDAGPERVWFWAESAAALEAQLQSHYQSGLYVAEKDGLVSPEAESFTVEDTLRVGHIWPEVRERECGELRAEDHNERTATDEAPTYNSLVFYETSVYAGGGYYVAAVPRRDLLRREFADERPMPEGETAACRSCRRERPRGARFCDWCGRSRRSPPAPSRRERVRRVVAGLLDRGRGLLGAVRMHIADRFARRLGGR